MKQLIKRCGGWIAMVLCSYFVHAQPNLQRIEYYLDTDPGYGRAIAISFTATKDTANAGVNIDPATLSGGVHSLCIRARDAGGQWSLNNKWILAKPYADEVGPGSLANINRIEYYLDTDPGYGKATSVPFGTGNDFSDVLVNIDPASLLGGVHSFCIRARDLNGQWGFNNKWILAKPYADETGPGPLANISRLEYYIDTDPGYGKATNVPFTTGTDLADLTLNLDTSLFSSGTHILCVRALDANGQWSENNRWLFAKPYADELTAQGIAPDITNVEYYIDIDPGFGKGNPIAFNKITNLPDYSLRVNVSGLTAGSHKLFVRSKDAKGSWSLDYRYTFAVSPAIAAPSIVVNGITKKVLCAKDSLSVSYHAKGTFNTGNIFSVELSDTAGNFTAPTIIGSYTGVTNTIINALLPSHLLTGNKYRLRVNSSNPAVTGITSFDTLIIRDAPYAPFITGQSIVNTGMVYPYSVPIVSGNSWVWTSSTATLTPSANTTNAVWNTAGVGQSIKVVEKNASGCISDTSIKLVDVYALRIENVQSSNLKPCPAATMNVTAQVSGVDNNNNVLTAQLSDAAGSFATPITIGTLTVNPGAGTQSITILARLPFPIANGTGYRVRVLSAAVPIAYPDNGANIEISKPYLGADKSATVCLGSFINLNTLYTTTGLTAVWNIAQPNNVTAAGIYRLIVTNANGCKDTAFVTVTSPVVAGIASVSATTNPICSGTTTTLTANGVTGSNAVVTWWTATGGTGTNLGTGTTLSNRGAGTYFALVTADCGTPAEATITITTAVNVAITSVTAAANPICTGTTTTLTANGVAGTNAVVTWWTATGGTGTNLGTGTTLANRGAGTYFARVTGTCGTPAEATITITNKINVAITSVTAAANPICPGTTTTLTANGVVGTNAVVTWWSATGGTGTNLGTGTTLANRGAGTYFARVTGDCGNPVEASVTITTAVNVAITSVTAAANPICIGTTTTLTANGVTGTNAVVTWWTATGGTGTNLGTGATLTNRGAGTYFARVTGTCGTPAEATITITNNVNVAITSVTAAANPICTGTTTTLTANGMAGTNAVVTWWTATGGTGTNLGTGTTLANRGAGTYFARVTGTCGTPVESSVIVTSKVTVGITSVSAAANPIPTGSTTTLTANGVVGTAAVVTWWTGTGGTGTNLGTGTTLTNRGAGTYYARVTGDCGNPVEAFITITILQNDGQWTWMKGDNSVNQFGIYGMRGTGSNVNKPGAREHNLSWADPVGNLWLFGGSGYSTISSSNNRKLNDLWKYNTLNNQWTWIKGDSSSNQFGIYGTKGVAADVNKPGARGYSNTWSDAVGNLWLFGGEGNAATGGGLLNDIWRFDINLNQWTWIAGDKLCCQLGVYGIQGNSSATNKPGARQSNISWIDTEGNLWLFGGGGFGTTIGSVDFLNDLWKFNITTNQWTWMKGDSSGAQKGVYGTQGSPTATNKPGAREGAVGWTDVSGNFWLFGGVGCASAGRGYLNDLWKFNPNTNQWTWIKGDSGTHASGVYGTMGVDGANNKPGARLNSVGWTDAYGNLWLLGGEGYAANGSGYLNDLWRFNLSTGQWAWVAGDSIRDKTGFYGVQGTSASTNKPGSRGRSSGKVDSNGNFWLFGGLGRAASSGVGALNDLWKYTRGTNPVSLPSITSFIPTIASSGATVTITGTNFTGATAVSFGGTAATSFTVVNSTTITAIVGSGANGSVSVTAPNGTATLAGFIYCPAFKPIINPVSPIAICSGDSVILSVTGGTYSAYAWSNAAATATITIKAAGKYTVTATTSTGCKGTADSVAVTINSLPAVPVVTAVPAVVTNLCPGTVVSLTSSAATKYLWNNGATTQSVNVRSANSYIVKVFNANGCSRKSVATAVSYQSCGTPATPVNLTKTDTTALLSWRRVSCVTGYEVQYREVGAAVFETVAVTDSFFVVTSLFPGTAYEWQVRAVCRVSPIVVGSYTTLGNFTTTGVKIAFRPVQGTLSKDWTAVLYPNPVQRDAMLNIRGTLKDYTISLSTIEGRELWKAGGISAQTVSLPVKGLSSGIYMVTVSKGKERKTLRLVIQR